MNDKVFIRGVIVAVLYTVAVAVGSFFCGYYYNRPHGTDGSEPGRTEVVVRELTTEQRNAIRTITEIRRLTDEAGEALRESVELNRRSSDISAKIRAEAQLLADYYSSVRGLLRLNDNSDEEQVE